MSHSIYHRSLQALCGLTICAFVAYLQLIADIGMSPWESLNQGIAMHLLSRFILCDLPHKVILIHPDISYDLLQVV